MNNETLQMLSILAEQRADVLRQDAQLSRIKGVIDLRDDEYIHSHLANDPDGICISIAKQLSDSVEPYDIEPQIRVTMDALIADGWKRSGAFHKTTYSRWALVHESYPSPTLIEYWPDLDHDQDAQGYRLI